MPDWGGGQPDATDRLRVKLWDTQLFLAALQTLRRPIKLHLIDAFLRLCLYYHAGAVRLNSGSNKRDQTLTISGLR